MNNEQSLMVLKRLLYNILTQESKETDVVMNQTMKITAPATSKQPISNLQIQNVTTHTTIINTVAALQVVDDMQNPEVIELQHTDDPAIIDLHHELRLETPLNDLLTHVEKEYIAMAYIRGGTKVAISEMISVPAGTLYGRIKKLKIDI